MEDFRLTVTGAAEVVAELERHFHTCGILTEHGLVSVYEGVAITVSALFAVGRPEVIAQGLADFGGARKAGLKVTFFAAGRGRLVVTDYKFATLAAILRDTGELHFERAV